MTGQFADAVRLVAWKLLPESGGRTEEREITDPVVLERFRQALNGSTDTDAYVGDFTMPRYFVRVFGDHGLLTTAEVQPFHVLMKNKSFFTPSRDAWTVLEGAFAI